jgi:tetratricopeptide (TPR) repeat protein
VAFVSLGERGKDAQLLSQALTIAEKISRKNSKARALGAIIEAYAKLGERKKAAQLLSHALLSTESMYYDTYAFVAIVEAHAKLGEKEKAAQLLSRVLSVAENIGTEDDKAQALQAIAEAYARLGDFRLARASALKILSRAREAKTLALILEIWAKSKDPRLADEASKDEE